MTILPEFFCFSHYNALGQKKIKCLACAKIIAPKIFRANSTLFALRIFGANLRTRLVFFHSLIRTLHFSQKKNSSSCTIVALLYGWCTIVALLDGWKRQKFNIQAWHDHSRYLYWWKYESTGSYEISRYTEKEEININCTDAAIVSVTTWNELTFGEGYRFPRDKARQ